jgi:tetratricopeptide (TPR) repeat protein
MWEVMDSLSSPDSAPVVGESVAPAANYADSLSRAKALSAAGRSREAVEACEACLRYDPTCVEAWFVLAELAKRAGHEEFFAEVIATIRELAPEEPRLAALAP